ncbi:MAG: paraquat-inducible protein A [Magnetococcales bacterium]|nr:paraquat-inducible protein A [Magnetococcales bacterium]
MECRFPDLQADTNWTLCHDCASACRLPALTPDEVACCPRCGAELQRGRRFSLQIPLALALTGLILCTIAHGWPLLHLKLGGRIIGNTLLDGVLAMGQVNMWDLALLVFVTSMAAPVLMLLGLCQVLIPLQRGQRPRHGIFLFKTVLAVTPWAMVGVYTLGLFVAYVKLTSMAHVMPGVALYAFFGLVMVMAATRATLDTEQVWNRLAPSVTVHCPPDQAILCHVCALPVAATEQTRCPRCHSRLHACHPASLTRTWALLWSAAILYIPANLYPVMTVIKMGRGQPDTILSGVIHLIESGMWPLAVLVFVASIVVPVAKIGILIHLLISVRHASTTRQKDRTVLYRVLETFGHWSMVDVFLVSILTALVDFGAIATIQPGIGASFFAAVVVLTILAAQSFDPRLIWHPNQRGAA